MTALIPPEADHNMDEARHQEPQASLDAVESLVPPPTHHSSGDQSREGSQPSSEQAASTNSSFLLTLKPARSRKQQEEPSFDADQTTDDERRRQTPLKRTDGESEQRRKLATKTSSTSRKGHAPPSRPAQQVFTNLVLPHEKVPRAPTSGTSLLPLFQTHSIRDSSLPELTPLVGMYFSHLPSQGFPPPKALRAHTGTLVGNLLYVIGGCDKYGCWPGVATFNTGELSPYDSVILAEVRG